MRTLFIAVAAALALTALGSATAANQTVDHAHGVRAGGRHRQRRRDGDVAEHRRELAPGHIRPRPLQPDDLLRPERVMHLPAPAAVGATRIGRSSHGSVGL